ncbi:hypothetical protein GCM10027168_11860 [Streptomyces capparidis]
MSSDVGVDATSGGMTTGAAHHRFASPGTAISGSADLFIDGDVARHLHDARAEYTSSRYVFMNGRDMQHLVRRMGVTSEDLAELVDVSRSLQSDPTLPFRRSASGCFMIDPVGSRIRRLEDRPFLLTADDDFRRFDSGSPRSFPPLSHLLLHNHAFAALMAIKAAVTTGVATRPRKGLDYSSPTSVCTVFHLRTITSAELTGEPALEGVHSDGVDHTMTTLLDMWNPANDCATTQLHSWDEETGRAWNDATSPLVALRHATLLDTLILADNELKHSVSPLTAGKAGTRATRDMLVLFTRRLTRTRHPSSRFESTTDHVDAPVEYVFEPSP